MLSRFWNLFRRKRLERELDAEFRYHLESLEAEYRARGLASHEARLAAHRDFGGMASIQEAYRDQRGIPMLETLLRNVRFSLRSMLRTPIVTLSVVATLAIGIGANTAIFSVINGVLIKPLPYPDSERLISMSHTAPGVNIEDLDSSPYLYFTERDENRTLEAVGLWRFGGATVSGTGEPERVRTLSVTSEILPILGIEPPVGRYFSKEDDTPDTPRTIILTYGYWQRRFGGDPSAVGRTLTLGVPRQIIGVMPKSFGFLNQQLDLIEPMRLDRAQAIVSNYYWPSIARLKPGVTLEQASADVARMIPIAIDSFPLSPGSTKERVAASRLGPNLKLLKDDVIGNAANTLWVLMGTIGMVLLIACANVANLILVRTEGRQQELSIRAALGAGRRRIAGELLTENAVLSLAGGLFGAGFAFGSLRLLLAAGPSDLPRLDEITIDSTVLIFAFGLTVLSGLLFGLLPVFRYARPQLMTALRAGRSSSGSRERLRARGVLVVLQVAFAVVLLIGAGLMIRTFQQLNNVNTGFAHPEEIQTIRVEIPGITLPNGTSFGVQPEQAVRTQSDILDRIAALPGVTSAAYTSSPPMSGNAVDLMSVEGKVYSDGNRPRLTSFKFVSPGLFETVGTPLLAGRDFTWADSYEKRTVVLISENLARREWGTPKDALGKRVRGSSANDAWREVVGVVGDVRDNGLTEPATEIVYAPVLVDRMYNVPVRVQRSVAYVIRSPRSGTTAFLAEIREALRAVNGDLPSWSPQTISDMYRNSTSRTSFTLVMLAIAGAMALLLGVIGIYGAISYGVSQRTREVGIRIALGAQGTEVQRMFLRQGFAMTAIGVVTGVAGAFALTRWMSSLLFGVSPLDPVTYAAVSVLLILAAGLASYVPARRATRVDPIDSLRAE